MKKFVIPVIFEMYGTYIITANSLGEAKSKVLDDPYMGFPKNKEYIDDSLRLDEDGDIGECDDFGELINMENENI